MQKGFNSDVTVRGQKFHVQTEDWGKRNPFLVSRIFCNGAVIKTIKTSYEAILQAGALRESESIKNALQRQHSDILDVLMAGKMP
ncbi:MAG: hypothetical protein IPM97_16520 [Bdellovibrionaceae bacterium]|nr:hypothetical protein [Pseudobdellovibrionaceae bacterium]